MKANIINKLAALLTASGMLTIIAPLTVTAANKYVNGGAPVVEADKDYVSITGQSALNVVNQGVYSGTNITATGTTNGGAGSARSGVWVSNTATVDLHGSTIAVLGSWGAGVWATTSSTVSLWQVTIDVSSAETHGLRIDSSSLQAADLTVTTHGAYRQRGFYFINAVADMENVTVSTSGSASAALFAYASSAVTVRNLNATATGQNSPAVMTEGNAIITVTGGTLRAAQSPVVQANSYTAGVTDRVSLTNMDMAGKYGVHIFTGVGSDGSVEINGGSLVATGGELINGWGAGLATVELNSVQTSNGSLAAISGNSSILNIRINNTDLTGGITGNANSTLNLSGSNGSTITGNVSANGSANVSVGLNNSTLTGASAVSDSATLALNVGGKAVWNLSGSSSLTTLSNSGTVIIANALGEDLSVSGAFVQDADGTLELNISGTGPIVNAGTASLGGTLTISGFSGTVTAKASELPSQNFTVIHTANGIGGDFATVNLGANAVDYVTLAAGKTNGDLDYTLGLGLSWFASGTNSHGNFTLGSSGTFEVDVVLSNTTADNAKNWDGESLTKLGDGTLILSATNTYTGTTNVSAGTLRAGAADIIASSTALNVSGEFDLNNFSQLVNNLSGSGTVLLGSGTLTVNESDNTTYSGVLNNSGALVKNNTGTLTLSGSSDFTGGSTINSGEINLTNLHGLGSGTVQNSASLRLGASGTFNNNVSGSGVNIIAANGVNISGNNSAFTGTWNVTGSGTMTSQNNLGVSGSTAVNIASGGALSLILGNGDYHFDQPLTGSGVLLIQNAGNISLVPSVPLVAFVPSFTGTVELQHNTLALTADNALPLTLATLVTGTNNLVVVDSDPSAAARNLGALSFSGGTVRFAGYDPHATRADTIIALSGTLSLSGGGTVEVVMPNPSQIPDGSKFTHIPLLQQDDGLALTLLISASGGVTGSPATLVLRDDSGRVVSDSYTLNLSHDGVTTDAIGTYDYLLSTGSANDGLYVAFGLKQVDIQSGRTLTLDQDVTVPAEGDDFTATIIGSGNLQINATNAITLNGTGNSYSGTTIVNTGTLLVGINEQMFASSTAFVINNGAAFDTNGTDQLVNNLSGSGLVTFTNNTLTVNNSASTSFSGTLNGSVLVKDGGAQLNANDAVANLTQVQIENGEIILGQNATVSASNNPAVIANGGTATFNSSALSTSGSVLILAKDNSPATVNLNNMTVSVAGNFVEANNGALTVTLNDSTATGRTAVANGGALNLGLNNSVWNMTGKSKLTTLTSSGGTITIDNVQGEDLTVSNGITGQTALNLTLSDSVKGNQEIWVVVDETNNMTGERFTLSHEVSYGMYNYNLVNANDGAWLVYTGSSGTIPPVNPPPVNPPTISNEGDTIINTAAAVAGFWFTQLDNLHKRMGELRYNKPAGADLITNIWIRTYGQQINANTDISGVKGFSETQYGVDLGTDHRWNLDAANQLYTGVFAGYGGADRDFHTNYSGNTDSGYGGLYATWLNNSGWYADVVAKGQYFRNEFSGADRGDYDSVGVGFSVEFGRQFEFKDGWFAEPSVQFSYLHLMNDNYTTRDGLHVDLTDADVLHIYGGARFGRNIKLTNSGMLQPYIKAGGLGQISSGNKLTVSGDHWRPNLDGARAVVGAGLIWQLDADSQLHLDYEASFGEKYDKPWGVNFGYRYQF